MGKKIKLLVVEDSDEDTFLLTRELQCHGYEPTHRRVETAGEMSRALQDQAWDIIVSDYTMPQFSGSEALKLFGGLKLEIPFILVSSTPGEEAAVQMIKAGANDYIIKGNLSRFVIAVEREMEAVRSRRALRRAEEAAHHLAAIVESSEDAIYSVNLDGFILSWNPAARKIYGYEADEIIGRSIACLFPLTRRNELLETMSQLRRGELVGTYETQRLDKYGHFIQVAITTSPIRNARQRIIGASVIARDISTQKREEAERLKLIEELTEALRPALALTGRLRQCPECKRTRDDNGQWLDAARFVASTSDATFACGLCPDCRDRIEAAAAN